MNRITRKCLTWPEVRRMGVTLNLSATRPMVEHADHAQARVVQEDGAPIDDDLTGGTLGQYRVGPILGRGSMARVYQADHLGLGRRCALKVMDPALVARRPDIVDRFWAEARAV